MTGPCKWCGEQPCRCLSIDEFIALERHRLAELVKAGGRDARRAAQLLAVLAERFPA